MSGNNQGKLTTLSDLLRERQRWRLKGLRVVWTNGCFELLHVGHVLYLECAKSLGDILVVGVNSDESFRRIKRREGPVVPQDHRARVLASLSCVDRVLIFDAPSPVEILRALQPDIFVKGEDYTPESIDPGEREAVLAYGGEIRICPGVPGFSTTELIHRIVQLYGHRLRGPD
ncbi:MAG TPA: D-glycero-beta-D-manno-heptose 1-phosphate adenylyltransferase [Bacteroidetes bacterium]|nr:D-glycero-beta-D-manno-heptose 1-phosphate adenylyltransferase [Bacteroidota bacterium]